MNNEFEPQEKRIMVLCNNCGETGLVSPDNMVKGNQLREIPCQRCGDGRMEHPFDSVGREETYIEVFDKNSRRNNN